MNDKTDSKVVTPTTGTQDEIKKPAPMPSEHGGPKGLEPTRYGDWEKSGRCIDF